MLRITVLVVCCGLAATPARGQIMGSTLPGDRSGLTLLDDTNLPPAPYRRYEIKQIGKLTILLDVVNGNSWLLEPVQAKQGPARAKACSHRWVLIPQVDPLDAIDPTDDGSDPFGS